MRTNTPDGNQGGGPTAGDTAFCAGCGKPMGPEAALCTACGLRRDGAAERTRVSVEPADRGSERAGTATVRGAAPEASEDAEPPLGFVRRWIGWIVAAVAGFFGLLLLLWALGGPAGVSALLVPEPPARAVRVLPLFDDGARLLVLHRSEDGAEGPGAAVVVELDPGGLAAGPRPELVPADAAPGTAGAPGVAFAGDAPAARVRIPLDPLAAGGPSALLPAKPADRYLERPKPTEPQRLEATAAYEGGGFEGRLRLATGGSGPVAATGVVAAASEADPALSATLTWAGDHLDVEAADGAGASWAAAAPGDAGDAGDAGHNGSLLFLLPDGAPPAVGRYEVRRGGEVLARIDLPEPPEAEPVVVGGGTRPGKILASPIKRAQGTAPPPPINTNNPLSYFDILSGAGANARGLTSANAMRQLASGFVVYEQQHGGFPDELEDLSTVLGDLSGLLHNQRTGDNPGFLYEKPTGGGVQPVLWESLGGQKDPTGAVLMSDGTIR